jgi:3',5'-cyclic AMP phosphodiesterase CpdA
VSNGSSSPVISRAPGDHLLLAHLSDPHLTGLDGIGLRDLLGKRLLGYLSWRQHRRRAHRREVLDALIADLHRVGPDHTVITGDLTHIGLEREFREVAAWLPEVGGPADVFVVPGNHDAYVAEPWARTFALWEPYLAGDGTGSPPPPTACPPTYPRVRLRRGVALVGVNTARPSPPFFAVGSLGRGQLQALAAVLKDTGARGLCRVVLIHHPPVPGTIRWRKRLTDARELASVIDETGVELVLHGHAHRDSRAWLRTPSGPAPVIGVRSASEPGTRPLRRARYHVLRLTREPGGWRLRLAVREYAPGTGLFTQVEELSLDLPQRGAPAPAGD